MKTKIQAKMAEKEKVFSDTQQKKIERIRLVELSLKNIALSPIAIKYLEK